jgi:flagellar motor switch protein FliG
MIAVKNSMHDLGIRKAAILLASLDEAAADVLLHQLPPKEAERVRQASMAMDYIDAEERIRVIDEFQRIGPMVPGPSPAGIDLDGPLARKYLSAGKGRINPIADPNPSMPFGFLHEAAEEKLWKLLVTERPQTIALVLSHLPSCRAGEVLSRFAPPVQAEVVRRLVELESTDSETLREVEQALETRLARQFAMQRGRAAGPDAAMRILASCDGRVVEGLLERLAIDDEPLAKQLGHRPLQFEDLVDLDGASLMAIFRAADPVVAQIALVGAKPQLINTLLARMAPKQAKRLRRKLANPGPIRLRDIEESQRRIAALARQRVRSTPRKQAAA